MTSETFQQPLLQVAQLSVSFPSPQGLIEAVNALSFDVHAGEVLALVGESGSGKSVTARTLVGLAGAGAAVRAEALILHGHDGLSQNLLACDARRWQQLRGREIGFVLQDALTSLDPLRRIGQEVAEPLLTHRLERGASVRERVAELLTQTGIPIRITGWRSTHMNSPVACANERSSRRRWRRGRDYSLPMNLLPRWTPPYKNKF